MSTWIYIDADNTLWDTDALFAEAQLDMLAAVERLSGLPVRIAGRLEFVRALDQAIAFRHHLRLGYPPALLIRALVEGLKGAPPDVAALQALSQGATPESIEASVLRDYEGAISTVPAILDRVQDGLKLASQCGFPVYVVSEGPPAVLRDRLRTHDLEKLTAGSLSAVKTKDLYARLKESAEPNRAVMIGDQPDRDIRLASEAGLGTVLVPSRFHPDWIQSTDAKCADKVAENVYEAVKWLAESDAVATSLARQQLR